MKIVLAAAGAALVIAVANPAFACGGGGYAYRAPHQVKAAAPAIAKSATPARSPESIEATGPDLALPSVELPSDGSHA
jgi:hypothetical protein